MIGSLVIDNVDLELLKNQAETFRGFLEAMQTKKFHAVTETELTALNELAQMLSAWIQDNQAGTPYTVLIGYPDWFADCPGESYKAHVNCNTPEEAVQRAYIELSHDNSLSRDETDDGDFPVILVCAGHVTDITPQLRLPGVIVLNGEE